MTVVTISEPWDALSVSALAERGLPNPVADYEEAVATTANLILWRATERAKIYAEDKYPAEGILETAKQRGCDLIVIALHGRRGISRVLLGSQATKVVALSAIPVLVCRKHGINAERSTFAMGDPINRGRRNGPRGG